MTNTSLDAALNELERVVAMWRRVSLAAKDLIEAKTATYRARNGRDVGIEDESGEKMWIVPSDLMSLLEGAIEHDFPETKSVPAQSPDDDELIGLNARLADALDEIRHLKAALSGNAQSTGWPSREVVAREIRRAMLDNPTDDSFNKRAEKREIIANEAADVILARFAAALSGNAGAVEANRPHKTMALDEYLAEPRLQGWHSVCFDVDGFGGVGVRYHGEPSSRDRVEP